MITLICIVGIVVCILYRRQAQMPLTIAAACLGVWVMMTIVELVAEPMIYGAFGSRPQGGLLVSNALRVVGFFISLVRAVAMGGLIWAVLAERRINFQKVRL